MTLSQQDKQAHRKMKKSLTIVIVVLFLTDFAVIYLPKSVEDSNIETANEANPTEVTITQKTVDAEINTKTTTTSEDKNQYILNDQTPFTLVSHREEDLLHRKARYEELRKQFFKDRADRRHYINSIYISVFQSKEEKSEKCLVMHATQIENQIDVRRVIKGYRYLFWYSPMPVSTPQDSMKIVEQYKTEIRADYRFIVDPSEKYECSYIAISQSNNNNDNDIAAPQLSPKKKKDAMINVNVNEKNGIVVCSVQMLQLLQPFNHAHYSLYQFKHLLYCPLLTLNSLLTNQTSTNTCSSYQNEQLYSIDAGKNEIHSEKLCILHFMADPAYSIETWMVRVMDQVMVRENKVDYKIFVEYTKISAEQIEKLLIVMMRINGGIDRVDLKGAVKVKAKVKIVHEMKETGWVFAAAYESNCGNFIALKDCDKEEGIADANKYNCFKDVEVMTFSGEQMRAVPLYVLKKDEPVQFYRSFYAIKRAFSQMQILKCAKSFQRKYDENNEEIRDIETREYKQFLHDSNGKRTIPIPFNPLRNPAYRPDAQQVIPRKIHQIYLEQLTSYTPPIHYRKEQPSAIRLTIAEALRSKHPHYEYKLWRYEDITRINFPYTYASIRKVLRLMERSRGGKDEKNLLAMVADLMRVEILYHHGGMYLDYKMEALKPLDSYLFYQQFYFELKPGVLKNAQAEELGVNGISLQIQNGIAGSIPHSPHHLLILQEFFRPENIEYPGRIITQTGRHVISSAYELREMYEELYYGQDFFYGRGRPCFYQNQTNDEQEIFTLTYKEEKFTLKIPCKSQDGKYTESYYMLGRTLAGNSFT